MTVDLALVDEYGVSEAERAFHATYLALRAALSEKRNAAAALETDRIRWVEASAQVERAAADRDMALAWLTTGVCPEVWS